MSRGRTHCSICSKRERSRPKMRAYGRERGMFWCSCDRNHVGTVSKKKERQKGKKECNNDNWSSPKK